MGITGEIVRSVFLKSKSLGSSNNAVVEKRKWKSSVRSYLCGDEHNSVLAADDSTSFGQRSVNEASFTSNRATDTSNFASIYAEDTASVRSSEATVTQPLSTGKDGKEKLKLNSSYEHFLREDAALTIQSAFRSFQARRARARAEQEAGEEKQENTHAATTPSREFIGTSVEAQTGNSSAVFDSFNVPRKLQRRNRAQVLKIQEDWDDSTVSSVISKMRMQNRVEAATRRERALAYAFSQQLRISSKKNCTANETSTGWSWLERWMAARQPEDSRGQKRVVVVRKRMLDHVAMEESCGSNEVVQIIPKNVPRPPKIRVKIIRRCLSRQNLAATHLCPRDHQYSEDVKKVWEMEHEREKRKRQKQPVIKKEGMKNATTHQVPLQHA